MRRILFLLFFISGFCGLLYQTVWIRLAFASFGVITPVLSVVVSVFMFGLFVGTWLGGRVVRWLENRTGLSALSLYAITEALIGVGAFAVPGLFSWSEGILLGLGESHSIRFLLWSALAIAVSLFPWCVLMGMTTPLMMQHMRETATDRNSFSFLYLANVVGAFCGVLVTALLLIEILGFRNTLVLAALANWTIAFLAPALGRSRGKDAGVFADSSVASYSSKEASRGTNARSILIAILFVGGLTSMGMEVVWMRAFSIVLRSQVYSYAEVLAVYLAATWIGSWLYRSHLPANRVVRTDLLLVAILAATTLPILLNDPRLGLKGYGALASILPLCALLGYLTPKLVDTYSQGDPKAAGLCYGANILGSIVGPLVASYLLLPKLGVKVSLFVLAVPYLALLCFPNSRPSRRIVAASAPVLISLFGISLLISQTYEEYYRESDQYRAEVRRDHTGTVLSYGKGMDKHLAVNGVAITVLTPTTKVMAHLPLATLPSKPRSALVICFGMGTTFRSLMSWDIEATAVELVPSVKEAFPYYFADAHAVLARPNGRVIIDDGRRFLRRTTEKFDVITLDPPPPVEAPGSSLLYSEAFYAIAKKRLNSGGILQQWIPLSSGPVLRAALRSIQAEFPYVRMFLSRDNMGYHFLASLSPIKMASPEEFARRLPPKAERDLLEWSAEKDVGKEVAEILRREEAPHQFLGGPAVRITDDRPFNEYFMIRDALRGTHLSPSVQGE